MCASFILLSGLPKYEQAIVLRTRKPDLLATCHMVVDVGAVYDSGK